MSSESPDLRASHEDRERVVDRLRVAAGEGRLDAEELDSRLEVALSARTLGELAAVTADLPPGSPARDALVVRQHGGRYVQEGLWRVPPRIELNAELCRVTLDLRDALLTSPVLRLDVEMVHAKLVVLTTPGMVIDADGLTTSYSRVKLQTEVAETHPRLRIMLVGTLNHARVIERRARH